MKVLKSVNEFRKVNPFFFWFPAILVFGLIFAGCLTACGSDGSRERTEPGSGVSSFCDQGNLVYVYKDGSAGRGGIAVVPNSPNC